MKNQQVARTLESIADLLEIKGDETYRVRAYRKAAAAIDGLAEDIEEICKRGELEQIPGVGTSIADKIADIVNTGTTPYYEELKARFPEGLTRMLGIPDIGPKTVRQLYEKLGVRNIDELEKAAKQKRIRKETDLGTKAELNILRGIETLRRKGGRLNLGAAWKLAEDAMDRLKRSPTVVRISEAGSLRRRQDTVGDIDLVVETSDPRAATDAFTHLPQVQEVIETGPSMSSVFTKAGLRMDLRMAPAENYGAMLHHFTGSKYHNIKLREMARKMGMTISEYGILREDTGELVTAGRTEEEIYAALGLPWIPPELREDRGEIEAAQRGRMPELVKSEDIKGDLHIHSKASDGVNTIQEMVEAARARGYSYIAICDHTKSLTIAHGLDERRLLDEIREIRDLNVGLDDFRVLAGSEVDIKADGQLDIDEDVLRQLDIVVASVHQRYKQGKEQMTRRIVNAIETGLVDIVAHPTGRIINQREPYDVDMDKVFDAAIAHSTAMEINSYPDRLDLNSVYARAAKDRGLKLSIDTDAHAAAEMANIRYGVAMARRGWLEVPDVLNAWETNDLLTWLQSRREHPAAVAAAG